MQYMNGERLGLLRHRCFVGFLITICLKFPMNVRCAQHLEDALGVQMVFPIPVELHSGNQGNSTLNSSAISAKECRHRVKGIHIQVAEVKSHLRLRRTVSNSSTASGIPPPLLSFLVRFTTGTVSVATEVQAEAQVLLARQRAAYM